MVTQSASLLSDKHLSVAVGAVCVCVCVCVYVCIRARRGKCLQPQWQASMCAKSLRGRRGKRCAMSQRQGMPRMKPCHQQMLRLSERVREQARGLGLGQRWSRIGFRSALEWCGLGVGVCTCMKKTWERVEGECMRRACA